MIENLKKQYIYPTCIACELARALACWMYIPLSLSVGSIVYGMHLWRGGVRKMTCGLGSFRQSYL